MLHDCCEFHWLTLYSARAELCKCMYKKGSRVAYGHPNNARKTFSTCHCLARDYPYAHTFQLSCRLSAIVSFGTQCFPGKYCADSKIFTYVHACLQTGQTMPRYVCRHSALPPVYQKVLEDSKPSAAAAAYALNSEQSPTICRDLQALMTVLERKISRRCRKARYTIFSWIRGPPIVFAHVRSERIAAFILSPAMGFDCSNPEMSDSLNKHLDFICATAYTHTQTNSSLDSRTCRIITSLRPQLSSSS